MSLNSQLLVELLTDAPCGGPSCIFCPVDFICNCRVNGYPRIYSWVVLYL
jgi:hypothetical protein